MPNVTVHLILADAVLDGWERAPAAAPFDPWDCQARNAFVQGSFGPDLGYFPGSDPFLSDLAHYVATADLTRSLLRSAATTRETAFAWGWLAHVLADQAIHPLVGEAAWELKTGERGGFLGISEDVSSHVRVEVGLDAHLSRRHPELRDRRTTPVFDRSSVGFLMDAYRRTYGLEVDPSLFLAAHHAAVRMSNHALAAIGVLGSTLPSSGSGPRGSARRYVERMLELVPAEDSMILAFLRLVPPEQWLLDSVEEVRRGFPARLALFGNGGLRDLPNFNLDTGRIQEAGPGSPLAERTLGILERVGGRPGPIPGEEACPPVRYTGAVTAAGEAVLDGGREADTSPC